MRCVFTSTQGGGDIYNGRVDEFGVALGAVAQGHLVWAVFAPASGVPHGALAGSYGGVGAEATVGPGSAPTCWSAAPAALSRSQPLSLEGQVGLNVAAGVTTVTLMSAN